MKKNSSIKISLITSIILLSTSYAEIKEVSNNISSKYTISNGDGLLVSENASITTTMDNAVENAGSVSSITNKGTITTFSSGDDAIYINGTVTGSITNDGTISETGGSSSLVSAIKLDTGAVVNGGIINNSKGSIQSTNNYAITLRDGAILNGGITNYGTIKGKDRTIYVTGTSQLNGGITNYGTINSLDAAIEIQTNDTLTGDIKNYGTIIATEGYSISLSSNTYNGNLYNYENAILAGEFYIANNHTNFTNSGLFALKEDFVTLSPEKVKVNGEAVNGSIDGDYIQTSTGEINLAFDGTDTPPNPTYSVFAINGDATFSSNAKISIDVQNSGSNINNNDVFQDVITTTGTLTTSTFNVTDDTLAWKFDAVNDGSGNIDITATSTGLTTVEAAVSSKYKNIGSALDSITQQNIVYAIGSLNTKEEIESAVETTVSQVNAEGFKVSSKISKDISSLVKQRQNVDIKASLSGGNSGDELLIQKNMWIKPFGSFGSQNDKDGINGFDLKSYGLGIGFDGEYKPNQNFGVALFYTNANVEVNNVDQESDLEVFTVLGYGNVPIIDDKTNFLYQVGYAWQKTNSKRDVFTGDTATADYTSKTASIDLKLLRDYQVNDNLLLQPMVSTTYRHFTNPAYKESGAGALNLDVEKFTSSELLIGLGSMIHYKLDDNSKIVSNVNIEYDLHNKEQTVSSSYQGASGVSYSTSGIDNGRWSYDVGVGYERDINETSNFNISYNYQGQGSDFSNNVVSAKFIHKF